MDIPRLNGIIKQLEQGRLIQGHRVHLPRGIFGRIPQRLTRWPLNDQEAARLLTPQLGSRPITQPASRAIVDRSDKLNVSTCAPD